MSITSTAFHQKKLIMMQINHHNGSRDRRRIFGFSYFLHFRNEQFIPCQRIQISCNYHHSIPTQISSQLVITKIHLVNNYDIDETDPLCTWTHLIILTLIINHRLNTESITFDAIVIFHQIIQTTLTTTNTLPSTSTLPPITSKLQLPQTKNVIEISYTIIKHIFDLHIPFDVISNDLVCNVLIN